MRNSILPLLAVLALSADASAAPAGQSEKQLREALAKYSAADFEGALRILREAELTAENDVLEHRFIRCHRDHAASAN